MKPSYFDFEIEREFACSPAVLFSAWADASAKAKWFVGPKGWVETSRTVDLREGGTETMAGSFEGKMTTEYTAHFYDVKPNQRIGYSFEVRLGGEIYSISIAVVEFIESSRGTLMKFHEQLAVFSGQAVEEAKPSRVMGTDSHFDRLAEFLGLEGNGSPTPFCGASSAGAPNADPDAN